MRDTTSSLTALKRIPAGGEEQTTCFVKVNSLTGYTYLSHHFVNVSLLCYCNLLSEKFDFCRIKLRHIEYV